MPPWVSRAHLEAVDVELACACAEQQLVGDLVEVQRGEVRVEDRLVYLEVLLVADVEADHRVLFRNRHHVALQALRLDCDDAFLVATDARVELELGVVVFGRQHVAVDVPRGEPD